MKNFWQKGFQKFYLLHSTTSFLPQCSVDVCFLMENSFPSYVNESIFCIARHCLILNILHFWTLLIDHIFSAVMSLLFWPWFLIHVLDYHFSLGRNILKPIYFPHLRPVIVLNNCSVLWRVVIPFNQHHSLLAMKFFIKFFSCHSFKSSVLWAVIF